MQSEPREPATPLWVAALILGVVFLLPPVRAWMHNLAHRWMAVLLTAFALSYGLTPVCIRLARSLGAVDLPDARKIHFEATPLLGGLAVYLGFTGAILANGIYSSRLLCVLAAGSLVFVVSLVDDIRELSATLRLLVHLAAVGLLVCGGIVLHVLPDSLGAPGYMANIAITAFWVVGITNAMNCFDGMDGLAGGLGVILAFFLGMLAFQTKHPYLGWVAVAMMGACMGFLPHNFRPGKKARIFLGDSGATFIGFVLASLAVWGEWAESKPVAALVPPLLIFGVLIFDMTHITVTRFVTGKVHTLREWLEYVGQDHLHHRIAAVVGGPGRAVLFIWLLTVCLGTSAMVIRNADLVDAFLLLLQAAMIVALVTILERRGRALQASEPLEARPGKSKARRRGKRR
ncbi:MAG: undecaprenyl/decaprenyl-phosphate alpha-N-acetylglucosaminyl 1-phosphate transferase [Proteobacteria bacterium]|nr:undecaprenyl/decaprenyl-phosphate alpha-N-acetylglucosaminyl 1-phosphate transferase [Pseudomonadota bacterium]